MDISWFLTLLHEPKKKRTKTKLNFLNTQTDAKLLKPKNQTENRISCLVSKAQIDVLLIWLSRGGRKADTCFFYVYLILGLLWTSNEFLDFYLTYRKRVLVISNTCPKICYLQVICFVQLLGTYKHLFNYLDIFLSF